MTSQIWWHVCLCRGIFSGDWGEYIFKECGGCLQGCGKQCLYRAVEKNAYLGCGGETYIGVGKSMFSSQW